MPNKRVLLQIRLVREQAADHLVTHQLLAHRVRFHVLVVDRSARRCRSCLTPCLKDRVAWQPRGLSSE
jgi:hypothetical protein